MTIRSRLPVLLSELIERGITVSFDYHLNEPLIDWKYKNGLGGHVHLDRYICGEHGANTLLIEKILKQILSNDPVDHLNEEARRIYERENRGE